MISLEEAQSYVLATCLPLAPKRVSVTDALGMVLAEELVAREAVPGFDNSAMDGYAVRALDTAGASPGAPVTLEVIGELRAGASSTVVLGAGQAVRIMTGAPVPTGADAIVMVESTTPGPGNTVTVHQSVTPGLHIRRAGEDVSPGDCVVAAGTQLGPGHLGVVASLGVEEVSVYPRPVVGVFSTGDELVGPGRPLQPGQIRDSNRVALLAALRRANCVPVDLGLVADDEAAIERMVLDGAARCDALISSGGVSMGDYDLVKVVLDRLGEMRWMQVAIKPAKPLAVGKVDVLARDRRRVPVFGLPGNPVSSLVSFELFARPALRRMAGHPDGDLLRQPVAAVATEPLRRRPDGKVHFARVVVTPDDIGRLRVRLAGAQGSHQLSAMAAANALAILPDGEGVDEGEPVLVLLLE
ncbi:MAG: molybdopterin molybdotransferase MoeA [Acidimicrobiales bacterium]|nr:molybdopterin molybdotransferase MoeA [Acidimicrobiales bacterium]